MSGSRPVLSPQANALFEAIGPREGEWERDIADLRQEAREIARAFSGIAESVASIEDLDAGGVGARLYRPRNGGREVLAWFHGGAWMLGGLDDHDALACAVANRAGCAVLAVDYRLAPEHPYPAAIDDCWAVTTWACKRFEQVAVGGDSSGGNLAAAVALRARDAGVELALQLLVYPALDPQLDSPFVAEFVARYADFAGNARYGENAHQALRNAWQVYVADAGRRAEQDLAPMRAASLADVAPAVVVLAEHDILRGEGEEYARRLQADGVPVVVHLYDGQVHGFYHLLGAMDDARHAVDRSAAALTRAFGREGRDMTLPRKGPR